MIAALFALALAADAASTPPFTITDTTWVRKPTADDLLGRYPPQALADGVSGWGTIACTVQADGSLTACTVAKESPKGAGFGAAALDIAPLLVMPPTVNGRPVAGASVKIPIVFRHPNGEQPRF